MYDGEKYGIEWEDARDVSAIVNDIYDKKTQANTPGERQAHKLVLNSMYGRFRYKFQHYPVVFEQADRFYERLDTTYNAIDNWEEMGDFIMYENKPCIQAPYYNMTH